MSEAADPKTFIKATAATLDIDGVAISDASTLDRARRDFDKAIEKGYIPPSSVPKGRKLRTLTRPDRHLRGARSIVSAYRCYYTGEQPCEDPARGRIAAYTRANHYEDLRRRLATLADRMELRFGCTTKTFSCYVRLAEKPIARRAGLGFYGKNGVIITPRHGSYVVLGEILTDLEMEPDTALSTDCGTCALCMEACPTGAIREPGFIDRQVCIQHLSSRSDLIPLWIRDLWQNRLYGCGICQEVCPLNNGREPVGRHVTIGNVGTAIPLAEVMHMNQREFDTRFGDNQIGMCERNAIRRNAILAAGNSGMEAFLPALETCATDPDRLIRRYSLWAMQRIRGLAAQSRLREALATEQDEDFRAELQTLLDGPGPGQ